MLTGSLMCSMLLFTSAVSSWARYLLTRHMLFCHCPLLTPFTYFAPLYLLCSVAAVRCNVADVRHDTRCGGTSAVSRSSRWRSARLYVYASSM